MITVAQVRAARGLVGWNQTRLAEASGLAISTIKRMEGSDGPIRGTAENVWKIEQAFSDAGVIFIDAGDAGPGVRLKSN